MPSQEYNSGKHIDDIVERTTCTKHNATPGFACFSVLYGSGTGEYGPAVCGNRIKNAGFNGEIHPSSLSRSVTKNKPNPRR